MTGDADGCKLVRADRYYGGKLPKKKRKVLHIWYFGLPDKVSSMYTIIIISCLHVCG